MFNQIYERMNSLPTSHGSFIGTDARSSGGEFGKYLPALTMKCVVAHWYLLPGLEFQRYGLAMAISAIRSRDRSSLELVRALYSLPPTFYLEADFVLKCLREQPRIGTYLDFSSTWLLPIYLLKSFASERAVLIGSRAGSRLLLNRLARSRGQSHRPSIVASDETLDLPKFHESFDTITCVARLLPSYKQATVVEKLWKALKPGGTLLVSMGCPPVAPRDEPDKAARSSALESESPQSSFMRRGLLNGLGRPRRYAIYGEDLRRRSPSNITELPDSSWRGVSFVARRWRRYPSLAQLQGRGVLAMKFIKPEAS
jgi:SAM-dependent methyltransferase